MSESCEYVGLIPWYVEGRLDPAEAAEVAGHLVTCEACVCEVATTLRVRGALRAAWATVRGPSDGVWTAIAEKTGGRALARLDLGSFLVGLEIGARMTRGSIPVRGDLRIMNRRIRLFDSQRGGSR